MATNSNSKTIIENEVKFFQDSSNIWWNTDGIMKPLHTFNNLRVPLVKSTLEEMGKLKEEHANTELPLNGLKILDAGCGGGIFCEPLAKLGAEVVGIDPVEDLIKVGTEHAALDPTLTNLKYMAQSVEDHAKEFPNYYDCVVNSEVLEHITERETFLEGCIKCLKPGGSLLSSTYNKTLRGRVIGIWLTEYVFRAIPIGAHSYDLFMTPEEVSEIVEKYDCKTKEVKGCYINPLDSQWYYMLPSVHYFHHAVKKE